MNKSGLSPQVPSEKKQNIDQVYNSRQKVMGLPESWRVLSLQVQVKGQLVLAGTMSTMGERRVKGCVCPERTVDAEVRQTRTPCRQGCHGVGSDVEK